MIGKYFSFDEWQKRGVITGESLGLLVSTAAQRWPDRKFLDFDGEEYSFSQLSHRVDITAADFLAKGLKPGNRLFLQADNSVGFLVTLLASWRIGLVPVPAIPNYRKHELLQILEDTKPEAVATTSTLRGRFYLDELDEILSEVGHDPIVRYIVDGPAERDHWTQIPQSDDWSVAPDVDLPLPPDPEITALILFTSGTTSRPKGVNISSRAVMANTINWVRTMGLSEQHTWYASWPLAHIASLSTAVFIPLMVGGKTVISVSWNPEAALRHIDEHKVDILAGSTMFLQDLVRLYKENPDVENRIKIVGVGGAMASPELIEAADELGIKAFRSFGMTELAGVAAIARPDDPLERRANYDGHVNLGTEIDTVDDDRNSVGFGAMGEIRVRGPQNLLSYMDAESTAASIDDDGWLYTGDIGELDEEGWLKVVGRKKDIINRGGEKFSASDIEQALMLHDSVQEASVIGAPDERYGEKVAAFLLLNKGHEWSGPEALIDHLEEMKLAKIKRPVEWHIVEEMPRTATGKVQKNVLLASRKEA